jgi:hypothetical protein
MDGRLFCSGERTSCTSPWHHHHVQDRLRWEWRGPQARPPNRHNGGNWVVEAARMGGGKGDNREGGHRQNLAGGRHSDQVGKRGGKDKVTVGGFA